MIKVKEVINTSEITVSIPWEGDLEEGIYDLEVPDVITDPSLPSNQYWKFKSWDDNSINRVRRINLTSDMAVLFEYELVSLPPVPKLNIPLMITLGVTSSVLGGYAAGPIGVMVGGAVGLVSSYAMPKYVIPSAQCIYCGKEFIFTTYNEQVWCPYCHKEQVVKKQSIRRG